MRSGYLYALGAYILWGLLPIYWKWLQHVPSGQVISHRITWSLLMLLLIISVTRQWPRFRQSLNRRILVLYSLAGILLSGNWLVYVWAVNAGHIVETSLGYFINPLLSIVLGMIFLRESLRPGQWVPVFLAAAGVAYLTVVYGSLPWIALVLAFSFGFYGLVKKLAPMGSVHGLTVETGVVFIPATCYLLFKEFSGTGSFGHLGTGSDLLMIGAGLVTIVPLLLFASAATRIPLTMIGIMQYIAPTIQFLIGVFMYHEPFSRDRLIGFTLVWVALLLFWIEGVVVRQLKARK